MVEEFHTNGLIHRNINPSNFIVDLVARPKSFFVVDYKLARAYADKLTKAHTPYRENVKLRLNLRFGSLAAQRGCEQSRRDDVESLGYVLVYFMKGKLPWEVTKGKEDAESKVLRIKQETTLQTLCKDLPKEFYQYLYYSRAIKFEEKPEYGHLKQLFAGLLEKKELGKSFDYDWNGLVADVRNLVCTNLIFAGNENNYKTVREEEKKTTRRRRRSSADTATPKPISLVKNEIIDKVRTTVPERRSTPSKHLESSCNLQPKDILEDTALLGTSANK